MAFGCRDSISAGQWLSNSEANSSSTLSPLAQPFIHDRSPPKLFPDTSKRPHRDRRDDFVQPFPPSTPTEVYPPAATMATDSGRRQGGSFPSDGSDWQVRRTLSSNLVQAEPFYPQYGFRGSGPPKLPPAGFGVNESDYDYMARNHTHWNGPLNGDKEWENGTSRRISSWMEPRGAQKIGRCVHSIDNNPLENSSWAEFVGKGHISNYASPVQHGHNDDVSLPFENTWHRGHIESYIQDHDASCLNWLDGSSMNLPSSMAPSPNLLSTSVLSDNQSANASVLQLNFPDVSNQSCGALCASTSPYYGITAEPGFHRNVKNDNDVASAYSNSKGSSSPFVGMNPYSSSTSLNGNFGAEPSELRLNNSLQRHRVSVTIREPNTNSFVGGRFSSGKSEICNNLRESCQFPTSPNENVSGAELKTDDLQKFSDIRSEVGKTYLSMNGSTEINDPNHNSATLDQSSNGVDSPCWKGASTSRYSPLFDSDSLHPACSKATAKLKDLELISLAAHDTRRNVPEASEKQDGSFALKDVNGDCPSRGSCPLPSTAMSSPFTTESTSTTGILNCAAAAAQSVLVDSASDIYHNVKVDIPRSSSFDILNLNSLGHRASEVKDIKTKSYCDTHFLVRSIYDLSALLSSCYHDDNVLKDTEYDILLLAKYNLEACLAKKFLLQPDNFVCQEKANHVGDSYCLSEEYRNILTEKVSADGDNCESNAYKRLWIEAEAALCSMKYELQVVRASVGSNNNMKQIERDSQGSSDSAESAVGMMKTSPSTAVFDFMGGSHACEGLLNLHLGLGDYSGSSIIKPHLTSESNKEDLDTSVMARLNVLRIRDSKISTMVTEQQTDLQRLIASEDNLSINQISSMFSDSRFITGMGSLNEQYESKSAKSSEPPGFVSDVRPMEEKRTFHSAVSANHGNQAGMACKMVPEAQTHIEEARLASRTGNIIESYIPEDGPWRAQLTGKHSTACSSDWEHVLKDEVTR